MIFSDHRLLELFYKICRMHFNYKNLNNQSSQFEQSLWEFSPSDCLICITFKLSLLKNNLLYLAF